MNGRSYGDSDTTSKDSSPFSYDSELGRGYFSEKQWNQYTSNYKLNCKNNNDVKSCHNNPVEGVYLYDSRSYVGGICRAVTPRVTGYTASFSNTQSWFSDLRSSIKWILLALLLSLVIG